MVKQTPNNDKGRSSVIGMNQQSSEKKISRAVKRKKIKIAGGLFDVTLIKVMVDD